MRTKLPLLCSNICEKRHEGFVKYLKWTLAFRLVRAPLTEVEGLLKTWTKLTGSPTMTCSIYFALIFRAIMTVNPTRFLGITVYSSDLPVSQYVQFSLSSLMILDAFIALRISCLTKYLNLSSRWISSSSQALRISCLTKYLDEFHLRPKLCGSPASPWASHCLLCKAPHSSASVSSHTIPIHRSPREISEMQR